MTRVLVYEYLSAGAFAAGEAPPADLLPEGLAMRDAMAADLAATGEAGVVVATRPGLPVPTLAGVDAVEVPAADTALSFLSREARNHDAVWVVAPETGGMLEQLARAVPPARWIGCRPAAIATAASKRRTLRRLADQGVVTPLAFAESPETSRWIVKPDDGAGSVDTRVHDDLDAARGDLARRDRRAGAVLEPFVEGEPLSLSLLCGPHAAHLLSVNRQRISVAGDGAVAFEGVELNTVPRRDPRRLPLAAMAQRVVQAIPGLRGFVGIDAVWHPRRGPVAIEVNPRVTSAYVGLTAALGRNLAQAIVAGHREIAHAG